MSGKALGHAQRWGIIGAHDINLFEGHRLTRREAIADHTLRYGDTWKNWHRAGYRAVKLSITWEEPERSGS